MKKRVVVGLILIVALVAAFAFRLIETYGLYIFDLLHLLQPLHLG